jgi:hypothetical protein
MALVSQASASARVSCPERAATLPSETSRGLGPATSSSAIQAVFPAARAPLKSTPKMRSIVGARTGQRHAAHAPLAHNERRLAYFGRDRARPLAGRGAVLTSDHSSHRRRMAGEDSGKRGNTEYRTGMEMRNACDSQPPASLVGGAIGEHRTRRPREQRSCMRSAPWCQRCPVLGLLLQTTLSSVGQTHLFACKRFFARRPRSFSV